jgi:hypothetical protein
MQLVKVRSRSTVHPTISMWATLHTNQLTGEVAGWIVDTWSERGVLPPFLPKMHWVPKEDSKFYNMKLNVDWRSSIVVFDEDKEIEPQRAAFIRATLATWEQEYLEEKTDSLTTPNS